MKILPDCFPLNGQKGFEARFYSVRGKFKKKTYKNDSFGNVKNQISVHK